MGVSKKRVATRIRPKRPDGRIEKNMDAKQLKQKIFDISYEKGTGHIGSSLCAIESIVACFNTKEKDDGFVLSSGHAHLAHSIVLQEAGYKIDPKKEGTHPTRDAKKGIEVSTGSLGHGIGIAVGMAMADRTRRIFCVSSDGESKEGSFWEALDVAVEQKLTNFRLVINANGYGAYKSIDKQVLLSKLIGYQCATIFVDQDQYTIEEALSTQVPNTPLVVVVDAESDFADVYGLHCHYQPLTEKQYGQLKQT